MSYTSTMGQTRARVARIIGAVATQGHVVAYQLDDGSGMVPLDQALAMARSGLIDAVVVTGPRGEFLRQSAGGMRARAPDIQAEAA
jgi:hypothetical protein